MATRELRPRANSTVTEPYGTRTSATVQPPKPVSKPAVALVTMEGSTQGPDPQLASAGTDEPSRADIMRSINRFRMMFALNLIS